MKKDIHPENYRPVMFRDASAGVAFVIPSTVATDKTAQHDDGNEYPLFELPISSQSHPFYTGDRRLVDTQGRIEKFNKKYGKK